MNENPSWIESRLLRREGFFHGFGTRRADSLPEGLSRARQVHGDRVLWVRAGVVPAEEEADALATNEERVVAVVTADCVPILLADRRGGRVAAVHAGWRGSRARIAERAVESLVDAGARTADLVAAIGPCIGRCCYEVSPELAAAFADSFGPAVATDRRLDLALTNRKTLLDAGLAAERIEVLEDCTFCDDRFHSFRREGKAAGRQFSFIRGRSLS